jgi:uncharacterized membrane protein
MDENITTQAVLITDDAIVFGILMGILGLVFYTSNLRNPWMQNFYKVIPPLLLCYFLPGVLNSFGIISSEASGIYGITSRYLLPACLLLFTLNLNLKEMWGLRKQMGLLFLTGTIGVMLGGPFAVWLVGMVSPETVGGEGAQATWRGLATLAGSWIGGGANQAALYTIFEPDPSLFAATLAVDVFVAYGWMAILILGANHVHRINQHFKADNQAVDALTQRMEAYTQAHLSHAAPKDYLMMLGLAFGVVAIGHWGSQILSYFIQNNFPSWDKFSLTSSFFWLILLTTLMGIGLSFTSARKFEGVGASRLATVFLYVLIASIGMQMNIFAIAERPGLFLVGFIWISFHALLLYIVAKISKTPYFFLAIGSMGNIGGVASASVTAAAFHPALISVAVIVSVFSYAIGTYAGYVCGILMQWVSP